MKTVLVIGASGGIGHVVAEELLKVGYKVLGSYYQDAQSIEDLNQFGNFQGVELNLKSLESIQNLVSQINDIYAVVNCSGIVQYEGKSIDEDIAVWNDTIAVNLTGNFLLAKYLYEILESNGRFIMISSTDSYFGGAITSAYSASKAGVNSLTKSLSLLFKDKKIRVNSIAPGWVETSMIESNGDDFLEKVADINPLKRNAKGLDVANLVEFLLSEDSNYLNGQVIALEGGYTNQDPTLLLEEDIQS